MSDRESSWFTVRSGTNGHGAVLPGFVLVTTCTVQGMARVGSRQARPDPWFLTGVSAEAPGSSVTSHVRYPGTFTFIGCPAITVTLEAGGADTYTQRAIPGS